ncbi:hypothetical protein C8F04DRAFT_1255661 [Mycena alexandri]|uniref:Uncharacterized protein n=1 Tax=Mycena alexandri TaxID=1745969 RepID=A0AAD6XB33_9AGAR|nr:hypothetical protein C8F04DRAFT_1255661 [Mycena alexandri]
MADLGRQLFGSQTIRPDPKHLYVCQFQTGPWLCAASSSTGFALAAKVEDKAEKPGSKVPRSLANLLGLGFQLLNTPRPIFDANGHIIAVLAGQPRNPTYAAAARAAFHAIMDAGANARFPPTCAAIDAGSSPRSMSTTCSPTRTSNASRVSQTELSRCGPPDYFNTTSTTTTSSGSATPICFVGSIFFCAAFNFGPNVWTFRHRDVPNLLFGWCAVQALGDFDPAKGGHLVLWDLKLPLGALILLPSATVAHSNVPVADGAGGIFRYLDNGCQTVEELAQNDPEEYDRLTARMAGRWEEGLDLLSTIDELLESG